MYKYYLLVIFFLLLVLPVPGTVIGDQIKIGRTKVYISGDEIIIKDFHQNFPNVFSVSQIPEWDVDFDWEKVDKFIYKQARKTKYKYLWIVVICGATDGYGKDYLMDPITIGRIDVNESKKYVDFEYWHNSSHNAHKMWLKDVKEYEASQRKRWNESGQTSMEIEYYLPKSIR